LTSGAGVLVKAWFAMQEAMSGSVKKGGRERSEQRGDRLPVDFVKGFWGEPGKKRGLRNTTTKAYPPGRSTGVNFGDGSRYGAYLSRKVERRG